MRAFWEDAAVDHGTTTEGSLRYRLSRALETWTLRARRRGHHDLRRPARGHPRARHPGGARHGDSECRRTRTTFPLHRRAGPRAAGAVSGSTDAFTLGFLGSFYGYEGLDMLLDALPQILRVRAARRELLLVGGGFEEAAAQGAGRSGLASRTRWSSPAACRTREVARYYSLVDLLVYPRKSMRLTETVTPLKPLEAMAQGRLLIASDVGGHRELIEDGVTGFLFRPDDPAALAARGARACSTDRDRWDEIKRRGPALRRDGAQLARERRALSRPSTTRRRAAVRAAMSAPLRLLLVGPLPPPSGGMANQTRQLQRLLRRRGRRTSTLVQTNAPYRPAWVGASARRARRVPAGAVPAASYGVDGARADVVHVMANSGWAWHLFAAPAIWIAQLARRAGGRQLPRRPGAASSWRSRRARVRSDTARAARSWCRRASCRRSSRSHGMQRGDHSERRRPRSFRPADAAARRRVRIAPHIVVARNLEHDLRHRRCVCGRLPRCGSSFPGCALSIAGSGPERASLEALAARARRRRRACDSPAGSTSRTWSTLYQAADLVLNPVRADNTPNSVLEALACGVPVVSTRRRRRAVPGRARPHGVAGRAGVAGGAGRWHARRAATTPSCASDLVERRPRAGAQPAPGRSCATSGWLRRYRAAGAGARMTDMYTALCSSLLFPLHERLKGHHSVALRRELERIAVVAGGADCSGCRSSGCASSWRSVGRDVPYYRDLFAAMRLRSGSVHVASRDLQRAAVPRQAD